MELLPVLKTIQESGGLLIGFMWLVFEIRAIRRDFAQHEAIYHHIPKKI